MYLGTTSSSSVRRMRRRPFTVSVVPVMRSRHPAIASSSSLSRYQSSNAGMMWRSSADAYRSAVDLLSAGSRAISHERA